MRGTGRALLLAVALTACAGEEGGGSDLDAAVAFDGAALGACAGEDYAFIPAADCPEETCLGSAAFALCVGGSYRRCACGPPGAGWTLVDAGTLLDGSIARDAAREASRGDGASLDSPGAGARD